MFKRMTTTELQATPGPGELLAALAQTRQLALQLRKVLQVHKSSQTKRLFYLLFLALWH